MRRIIRGKVYDTDTATRVGGCGEGAYGDFDAWEETLYRKRTGEYFIHGHGGARTRYATHDPLGGWTGGSAITPLSQASARKWAESHLTADAYEAEFGAVGEGEGHVMTVTVSEATYRNIRTAAAERGCSMGAVVDAAIAG